jgi:hypothetical protein
MFSTLVLFGLATACLGSVPVRAAPSPDFQPDPRSVQRYESGYRYPQAGWIVLHIEGAPYERGVQHGRLMAPEIAAFIRCFAALQAPKDPTSGWKQTRILCNSLFMRGYEKEYLEEMKGIADGASAAGARIDGRPLDLLDIVALNAFAEVETLPSALEATPTGLEGIRFPKPAPAPKPAPKPMHCSAFAATGPATRDGKVVFGHITMFGLYASNFFNVWLDVKPAKGHRVLMQTSPGGIQSGLDYYLNDAGLVVCETTIAQTRFDIKGAPLASRIRQALQYADSIDKAVEILGKGNNGLYTNEWLLADVKTNEIAMYELGTHKTRLRRSSKNEWFADTPGFYWGCNNTKDLDVRLETLATLDGRPSTALFVPAERDKTWMRLYDSHKGKIDADFGKLAFTTPILTASSSLDAKFTTTDMARDLQTWALFGPPLGRSWQPTEREKRDFPEIRPLVSHPWTILHAGAPERTDPERDRIVDLHDPKTGKKPLALRPLPDREDEGYPATVPAWHGTLLPGTDSDLWLALSFPAYQGWASMDNALRVRDSEKGLTSADRDRMGVALFEHRALYELGVREREETPLSTLRADYRHNDWARIAQGKGVLFLHTLRSAMGAEPFDNRMEAFGKEHGGKPASATAFRTLVEKGLGKEGIPLVNPWVNGTGLPRLKLAPVVEVAGKEKTELEVTVSLEEGPPLPSVPIAVETAKGEIQSKVTMAGKVGVIRVPCDGVPLRVVVDKYGLTARSNGGPFSLLTFYREVEQALIVYGTAYEEATNREAARVLQEALRRRGANVTIPIKSDREVTEAELKEAHVLLVGRPSCNKVTDRWRGKLPVSFGSSSVRVRGEVFAHPDSAVLAAAENPLNRRFSVVVMAGLGAASTLRTAPLLGQRALTGGEVVVVPAGGKPHALVVPPKELVSDLGELRAARTEPGEKGR